MKNKLLSLFTLSLVALAASVTASAQVPTPTPHGPLTKHDASMKKLSRSDHKFLEKAAKSGAKEVAVSDAVASRLAVAGGKDFAMMMVTAHTAVNSELAALAAKKGVTLPPEDPDYTSKWSQKTKDLDEDYFEEMVSDHKKAVSLFEKAAKSEDPEIAAFAVKTLPALRHHLTEAEALEERAD